MLVRQLVSRSRVLILAGLVLILLATVVRVAVGQQVDGTASVDDPTSIQAERQQYKDAVEQWHASAAAAALDDPSPVGTRPAFAPDGWREGILGRDEADTMEQAGYDFGNVWMHSTGDEYLAVFAGASSDSPYGVLLVQHVDPATMESTFERVVTDIVGPVEIADVGNMTLTIKSTEGDGSATYDVETDTLTAAA